MHNTQWALEYVRNKQINLHVNYSQDIEQIQGFDFLIVVEHLNDKVYIYLKCTYLLLFFLGMYDGGEHTPKLLACSHTVCLHCLSRIAGQNPAAPTFRCPICRDNITVPRGGVAALPPSFLVNQLLDLMASQRREVVPKCSIHFNQVSKNFMVAWV